MLRSKEKREQFWFKLIQAGVLFNSDDCISCRRLRQSFLFGKRSLEVSQ